MTLPAPCDTQLLAELCRADGLTLGERLVLVARALEPDLPVAELARQLGVNRTTATRALAKARARDLQVCASAPPPDAPAHQVCASAPPPMRQRTTPSDSADPPAVLARSEPQPQERAPLPPRATPPTPPRATEPEQGQLLEDPARQVVALRKANGLAGRNVRTIARVLLEMADEGHPQAEVIDALGRCLVVSAPSCALTLNEGKVARPRPQRTRVQPDAWTDADHAEAEAATQATLERLRAERGPVRAG